MGRRENANLTVDEEVIYRSEEITPKQSSLLERPNFAQYPTEQELSESKDSELSQNGKEDAEENKKKRLEKSDGKASEVSSTDALLRDAVADVKRKSGIEVITDNKEAQRVLEEENESARMQATRLANERFNTELNNFKKNTHNGLLHLGKPSQILEACGVTVEEITLSPKTLNRKLKQHNLR